MKWIVVVRRDTGKYFQVRTYTRVCSRHSKPSPDYLPSLAGHKRTLKPAELQSVFPWKKEPTKRSPIKREKATETTNANADVPTCDSTRCEIFVGVQVTPFLSSITANLESTTVDQSVGDLQSTIRDIQIENEQLRKEIHQVTT